MAFSTIDPIKTWKARHTDVYLALASDITVDPSTPLYDTFSTAGANAIAASAKNVTITPPTTDVEKVDLLGLDTNGFQNALLDSKPPGVATITGTFVLGEDETLEIRGSAPFQTIIVSGSASVSGPPASTRYQLGKATDLDQNISILVNLQDFAQDSRVSFLLHNAKLTKFGDVTLGTGLYSNLFAN